MAVAKPKLVADFLLSVNLPQERTFEREQFYTQCRAYFPGCEIMNSCCICYLDGKQVVFELNSEPDCFDYRGGNKLTYDMCSPHFDNRWNMDGEQFVNTLKELKAGIAKTCTSLNGKRRLS